MSMKTVLSVACLSLFCLLVQPPCAAQAQPVTIDKILADIETRYNKKSFHADFKQFTTLMALDITEESAGKAWFSHPGKMKWQYLSPGHHEFITNGKTLWFYQPLENQVSVSDAAAFFKAGSGGSFLSDVSLVRENYTATIKKEFDTAVIIQLLPKNPSPDISAIDLHVLLKNRNIIEVVTYNAHQDTTRIRFENIVFKTFDKDLFEFKPPEDISIIEMTQP